MTSVLVLRLEGPMQSWGTQSRFDHRDTGLEPSKSGVIGLLCAALGRPRTESVDDLAALAMAVRVDREGVHRCDFHTAGGGKVPGRKNYGVAKASGATAATVISRRFYLADAMFLVAIAGGLDLLKNVQEALTAPCWPIFLGRKSFVPSMPVLPLDNPWGGIREAATPGALLEMLPWEPRSPRDRLPDNGLRLVEEARPDAGSPRADVPVTFAKGARQFRVRHVATRFIHPPVISGKEPTNAY